MDDYLEFYSERGKEPERPCSGKFNVRLSPDLHRRLVLEAKRERISLNKLAARLLDNALGNGAS